MGYRIVYDGGSEVPDERRTFTGRSMWMTVCVFAVFVLGVSVFWDDGWDVLKTILFPGDWTTTKTAAEEFVQAVRSGSDFSEAVMGFCAEIISNG